MSKPLEPSDLLEMADKLGDTYTNTEDDDHAFVILGALIMLRRLAREMREAP